MYYVRKLDKPINLEKIKNSIDVNNIPSDILTQEFKTTNNTLSFWQCETLEKIQDTFKAILLSATSGKVSQFIILEKAVLLNKGIDVDEESLGTTGYKGFGNLHVDLINLDYEKIGILLECIANISKLEDNKFIPKLDKDQVWTNIREVVEENALDEVSMQSQKTRISKEKEDNALLIEIKKKAKQWNITYNEIFND